MKQVACVAVLVGALLAASAPAFAQAGAGRRPTASSSRTVSIAGKVMADANPSPAGTISPPDRRRPLSGRKGASEGAGALGGVRPGRPGQGREVVACVSGDEIKSVAKMSPQARGASRVELLKGNDYLARLDQPGGTPTSSICRRP